MRCVGICRPASSHPSSRDTAGETIAGNNEIVNLTFKDDDDDVPVAKSGGFAALGVEDGAPEEDEDFGGLMVRALSTSTSLD